VKGIMSGVRVLEVAAWTYVPAAGAVLAEWGADVIKIEHPESGDPQRALVTSGLVPTGPGGINHMIELPNRGKRSVGLDIKSEEGHRLLLELAATSDVFLTNFLPDARRKLKIEVEDLRAANPDIIYVRGSGQGQHGPELEKGGYDGCSYWARAVADIVTPVGDWPIPPPGPAFGDLTGGMFIAGGISAALFHRERTGEALVVDNSLLSTAMWATSATILGTGLFGNTRMPVVGDRTMAPNPLVGNYRTGDDRFLCLMMLQPDRYWVEFVTTIGHPELIDDERFKDGRARYENRQECVRTLDAIFATKTLEEWRKILEPIEGVWAPVQTSAELLEDPQVLANGYIREVTASTGATFRMVPSPLLFDDELPDLTRAPDHGEHTDEILQELGYDMDQIMEFKISGAIL
jgi:crotonobetainyl-CoA:carnitine CoA-transferase CaiB-like acyl-CoA transferase